MRCPTRPVGVKVSVLFNESKLLKCYASRAGYDVDNRFSTLQRVEIAEIVGYRQLHERSRRFSTLQRVEIAEMYVDEGVR